MTRAHIRLLGLALVSFLLAAVPARAITVMTISGTVRDAVGRPIVGALVSDGRGQTRITDQAGFYKIEESSASTYVVRVSRAGIVSQSRSVTPVDALMPVDFNVLYTLSGTIAPKAFANTSPTSLSITARSGAPAPHCVSFLDLTSGTSVGLTYQSTNADGSTNWSGTYSVPSSRTNGTYSWQLRSDNCAGTTLGAQFSDTMVVDSVPPILRALRPIDGGNVSRSSTPITAVVADGVSGVNPALTTVTVNGNPVPVASFTASTGVIKSQAVSIADGANYTATVSVTDYAGNMTTATSHFLGIRWTVLGAPDVNLGSEPPVNEGPDLQGKVKWKFPQVTLHAESYDVRVSRTNHAGWGNIPAFLDTRNVRIGFKIAGADCPPETIDLCRVTATSAIPDWNDGFVLAQQVALIGAAADFANTTVRTSPATLSLGDLMAYLPPQAESPYLIAEDVSFLPYESGETTDDYPCYPGQCQVPCTPALTCINQLVDDNVPDIDSDYLVAYLSDDEAVALKNSISAGETGARCSQVQGDPVSYQQCMQSPLTESQIVGMVLQPDLSGASPSAWVESSQLVWWWAGQGKRPDGVTLAVAAGDAANSNLTSTSVDNWGGSLCGYMHCNLAAANDDWENNTVQNEAGECADDECRAVDGAYAYKEMCVDQNGNAIDPANKKCKQAGYMTSSDWWYTNSPWNHYIYAGWYKTRGTADGYSEDLAAQWSGSDEAASMKYVQSAEDVYLGAREITQTTCGRTKAGPVTDKTDEYYYDPGSTIKRYIVIDKRRYENNEAFGMGQMVNYRQNWFKSSAYCDKNGESFRYSKEWRTVSTSVSMTATEKSGTNHYNEGHDGQSASKLVHYYGPSGGKTLVCTLKSVLLYYYGGAAGAAADFVYGNVICNLDPKSWEMGLLSRKFLY